MDYYYHFYYCGAWITPLKNVPVSVKGDDVEIVLQKCLWLLHGGKKRKTDTVIEILQVQVKANVFTPIIWLSRHCLCNSEAD